MNYMGKLETPTECLKHRRYILAKHIEQHDKITTAMWTGGFRMMEPPPDLDELVTRRTELVASLAEYDRVLDMLTNPHPLEALFAGIHP